MENIFITQKYNIYDRPFNELGPAHPNRISLLLFGRTYAVAI